MALRVIILVFISSLVCITAAGGTSSRTGELLDQIEGASEKIPAQFASHEFETLNRSKRQGPLTKITQNFRRVTGRIFGFSNKEDVKPSGSSESSTKLGKSGEIALTAFFVIQIISMTIKMFLPRGFQNAWSQYVKIVGGVSDDAIDANSALFFL